MLRPGIHAVYGLAVIVSWALGLAAIGVSGVLAHAPCPVLSGTPAKVAVAPAEPATDRQAS